MFDLLRRHLLDHLLEADCRVGVAADRRKHVPHIGPHEIRLGNAAADLVVPADTGLGAGVTFHCRAQVPFESAGVVARNAETHRIHHPDQFLGIGIAGAGRRQQLLHGFLKAARFHEIARRFDIRLRSGHGQKTGNCKRRDMPFEVAHVDLRSVLLKQPKNIKRMRADKRSGNKIRMIRCLLAALILCPLSAALAGQVDAGRGQAPAPLSEEDFLPFDERKAALGRLLFYDPILSGNRNISCGTCHHHDLASADALPLGVGEGGEGIGRKRTTGSGEARIDRRVPRNAPALFNLGHKDITLLFHDGRLSVDNLFGNGFNSPAEEYLPKGLNNIVAAQALFPMTSETEMAGHSEENEIAGARNNRIDYVWPLIAERIRNIPEYATMFSAAYADIEAAPDINIVHVANAIGDFVISEWRSFDSPYDRYLAGDATALSEDARAGMEVFFGKGGCSGCHSGPLLSDQKFHALALPQFGPGRTRMFDLMVRDVGRMGETDRLEDAYRFRTPSLRNVALTAPYGHNGAYAGLEGIIRHHLDPQAAFDSWSRQMVSLPEDDRLAAVDFAALEDRRERMRVRNAVDIEPIALEDRDVQRLVAFLNALTGDKSVGGRLGRPDSVPSGLQVD